MAFPQFQHIDAGKSDLDEWYDWFYGPSIAAKKPTTFGNRLPLGRAKRVETDVSAHGPWPMGPLSNLPSNPLSMTNPSGPESNCGPGILKGGKEKGRARARLKDENSVYQDHLKTSPGAEAKTREARKKTQKVN